MAGNIDRAGRPLSPHMQIYKWQWTMALSILHRVTGVALAVGTLLLVWWLASAAYGEAVYEDARSFLGSWIGRLLLFGWSIAFFYHLCNGIRHMLWDTGKLLDLKGAYASGMLVLAVTAVLTAAAWIGAYLAMGAF
ncbi:MAG TPA: succinate dehydrogenase, cytochrome b556 subunit [Kiloniellales bacterium]|nr:succinate dehydrogenase, cytochrome b556 subunit [Kiloniellales bacterium]